MRQSHAELLRSAQERPRRKKKEGRVEGCLPASAVLTTETHLASKVNAANASGEAHGL